MSLFIRTLQRSTAVSSACVVNIKGKEWMLVCRPKTFIELWSEADGCLTPRGATELGEVTHVVPLPQLGADVAFFLAITASDRVVLLRIDEGDAPDKPCILEAAAVDLEAETPQQAAFNRVAGAAFSRPVFLHMVHGADLAPGVTAAHNDAAAAEGAEASAAPPGDAQQPDGTAGEQSPSAAGSADAGDGSGAAGTSCAPDAAAAVAASAQTAALADDVLACYVTAVSLRQGQLYFVEVFADVQGSMQHGGLVAHGLAIPPLADDELAGSSGVYDEIVSVEMVKRKEKGTRIVADLVMLCSASGGRSRGSRPERYMRLARVRFDSLTPSAGPSVNWRAEAPFYNRTVDPTASLLHSADVGDCSCLLTLSQRQVLIHHEGLLGELTCDLPAPPVATVETLANLHVIADAWGGLSLLDTRGDQPRWCCKPILGGGQLPVASALCYVPSAGDASATTQAGWLYVGSHNGDSQLLTLPRALADDWAADRPLLDAALRWQLADSPALESLAPVQAQLAFEHPPGSGEQRLVMCCGAAPTGSVRVACVGVGLTAGLQAEMGVQGRPAMWALRRVPGSEQPPRWLALSSELAGATSLLDVGGGDVRPVAPGAARLQLDAASLLVANLPDFLMLQVTSQEVRTMPLPFMRGRRHSWAPPAGSGAITVAAAHGGTVLVACGATLHHLQVAEPDAYGEVDGPITHVASAVSREQVASLAVFSMPAAHADAAGGHGPQATLWALVGMWISNGVALWRLVAAIAAAADCAAPQPELLPLLRMPGGTPRSLLVHRAALDGGRGLSQALLLAGSSSGEVAFCPIHSSGAGLSLGAGRVVQAGLSEVCLVGLGCGVLAVSDEALLLRHNVHSTKSDGVGAVEAVRVSAEGVVAAAGLDSDARPSGLAWMSEGGGLSIGQLELEARLRWRGARIGDTPLHAALFPSSRTLLLATQNLDSLCWLRLLHATSLRQLEEVQLREGQQCTAVHVALVAIAASRSEAAAGAAAELDLAIVAHHAEPDAALWQPGRLPSAPDAALSFFSVNHQPAEDAAEDRYQLRLHGTRPVPNICHALTIMRPSSGSTQLVAACHSGVQVFSLSVTRDETAGSLDISLVHLYKIEGGLGCITALQPVGDCLAASPLLGSVIVCGPGIATSASARASSSTAAGRTSAETAAAARQSAEADGSMEWNATPGAMSPPGSGGGGEDGCGAAALRPRSADVSSLNAAAFLPLTGDRFLVAAHPTSILLLRRFTALEAEAEVAMARYQQQMAEGGRRQEADEPGAAALQQPNLVPLGVASACRTQHNVVGLLPGELGVPHHLLPASCCLLPDGGAPPAAVDGGQPDGTNSAEAAGGRESALFVTRDGGMGIIQVVGQSEAALLAAAQAAARTGKFSLHDCSDGRTHEAVWSLQSFDADEEDFMTLPSNAVDGDLVATMLDLDIAADARDWKRSDFAASEQGARAAQLVHELSLQVQGTN